MNRTYLFFPKFTSDIINDVSQLFLQWALVLQYIEVFARTEQSFHIYIYAGMDEYKVCETLQNSKQLLRKWQKNFTGFFLPHTIGLYIIL